MAFTCAKVLQVDDHHRVGGRARGFHRTDPHHSTRLPCAHGDLRLQALGNVPPAAPFQTTHLTDMFGRTPSLWSQSMLATLLLASLVAL